MKFKKVTTEAKDPIRLIEKQKRPIEVQSKKLFEGISFKNQTIKESVLDPVNKELCSDIFLGKKMKVDVRNVIKKTFLSWFIQAGYSEENIIKMIMIGSSAGYQYSKSSDVDINIQVDLTDKEIKDLWSILPNGNTLFDTLHPINYYLTTDDKAIENADSAYDVLDNKWVKEPEQGDYKAPYNYALEIAKFFMYGIDNKIAELERDLKEMEIYKDYLEDEDLEKDEDELNTLITMKDIEIRADLDAIYLAHHLARSFRKEAFEDDYESDFLITIKTKKPNESINNVIYKIMERFGYFEKISKYDKIWDEYKKEDK